MNRSAFLKLVDALAGSLLCRLFGRLPSVAVDNERAILPPAGQVRHILVIRPGGMGDMIVLLPVIRLLQKHFTNARIDIACEKRNLDVLRLSGISCHASAYDANPLAFLNTLRKGAYDIALDTEQFHNFSALFAFLSGAPARVGFKINPRRNPLYTHIVNYSPDGPESRQFMRLVEPLGIAKQSCDPANVLKAESASLSPALKDELDCLSEKGPLAVIHIGASTVYKRWSSARFVELARGMRQQNGCAIALIGDRNDVDAGRRIVRAAGADSGIASYAGRLKLDETAALMERASLFVGGDSGIAHLAVALGLRTVVLFGPSDHLKWGTEDERHATVRTALPCSPCFIFGYHKPCRSIACMNGIRVDAVLAACRQVMESPAASSVRATGR